MIGGPKQGLYTKREICSPDDNKEIWLGKKSQKSQHSTAALKEKKVRFSNFRQHQKISKLSGFPDV